MPISNSLSSYLYSSYQFSNKEVYLKTFQNYDYEKIGDINIFKFKEALESLNVVLDNKVK